MAESGFEVEVVVEVVVFGVVVELVELAAAAPCCTALAAAAMAIRL